MKRFIIAIILVCIWNQIQAQGTTVNPLNTWYFLNSRTTLNEQWSLSVEVHERTQGLGEQHKNFLFRPSIDYHLNPNAEVSVGYSLVQGPYTAPTGEVWSQVENNLWEQLFFKFNVGQVHLYNRLRLENRFLGTFLADGSKGDPAYGNRFRYRMGGTRDLKQLGNHTLFVHVFDEVWLPMNEQVEFLSFGRNWFYAGLGWKSSPSTNYQLGFMKQRDFKGGSYYNTPIIQATLTHNFKRN